MLCVQSNSSSVNNLHTVVFQFANFQSVIFQSCKFSYPKETFIGYLDSVSQYALYTYSDSMIGLMAYYCTRFYHPSYNYSSHTYNLLVIFTGSRQNKQNKYKRPVLVVIVVVSK